MFGRYTEALEFMTSYLAPQSSNSTYMQHLIPTESTEEIAQHSCQLNQMKKCFIEVSRPYRLLRPLLNLSPLKVLMAFGRRFGRDELPVDELDNKPKREPSLEKHNMTLVKSQTGSEEE